MRNNKTPSNTNTMSNTPATPLKLKMQLDAADNILRYLAIFLDTSKGVSREADQSDIDEIHNAVADYAAQYWPDGPKLDPV